ncbi:histidinol dehydrogenase [Longispora sp. NPDC051575]|uniref:histidinol dehydrogenase n=1 Tax=Longispora sp. NPDC051575 TaxID=3154943 RepID=UPI003419F179
MLNRIDLRGDTRDPRGLLPRARFDVTAAIEQIRPVVEAVREHGAAAVKEATHRFDRVETPVLRVPEAEIAKAADALEGPVRAALEEAIARVRVVHAAQLRPSHTTTLAPGGTVTEKWLPVGRVGLYVPGGLAMYPSSVVMNVVPAQVAGVGQIVVASPPQADNDGLPDRRVLAACALLGVTEVYAMGGAQAIAALGYGTEENRPVDMITGPGNIWVTAAKRLLRGTVGIDSEAGPTEIAILADATADPAHVAADLISQAEHDPLAASVLVTTSVELADAVDRELETRVAATKHHERVREALTGPQSGIVLVGDIEQGLAVVDDYAAEHLEIQTADAPAVADRVRNAGAIFVGAWSPVSLGDYCAGSNHVLPTGGCARHSSGLSTHTFLKAVHVIHYDEAALREVAGHVVTLAEAEDLPAHGEAVTARFR